MPHGDVHTVHRDGKWLNEVEGSQAPLDGTFDRKDEAVAAGRKDADARGVEHVIHGLDGQIHEENSHGHDPRNIPG